MFPSKSTSPRRQRVSMEIWVQNPKTTAAAAARIAAERIAAEQAAAEAKPVEAERIASEPGAAPARAGDGELPAPPRHGVRG